MKLPLSFTTSSSTSSSLPLLHPRQSTTDTTDTPSCSCTSGGAMAGIIIGSVVGILLLLWLIRGACRLNRGDSDLEGRATKRVRYDGGGSGSRGRRHSSRDPAYVSYRAEKPGRRYRERDADLQRPGKVYAV